MDHISESPEHPRPTLKDILACAEDVGPNFDLEDYRVCTNTDLFLDWKVFSGDEPEKTPLWEKWYPERYTGWTAPDFAMLVEVVEQCQINCKQAGGIQNYNPGKAWKQLEEKKQAAKREKVIGRIFYTIADTEHREKIRGLINAPDHVEHLTVPSLMALNIQGTEGWPLEEWEKLLQELLERRRAHRPPSH